MAGSIDDGDFPGVGGTFGKYELVAEVGSGGFGVVYEARLPGPMGFSKRVAIKRIRTQLLGTGSTQEQAMINEARIGGRLHHPNIVDVLQFDREGRHWFLVMEFVDGPTFADLLRLRRRQGTELPPYALIDLAIQVCRGLHHAHTFEDEDGTPLNLVHRDLKPGNIIVDRKGVAKILDFGIARAASNLYLTTAAQGVARGTPRYMSPEQITGEFSLGPPSDVFSLAVVLCELVTGELLFDDRNVVKLLDRVIGCDVGHALEAADEAIPGMGTVLERALQRRPHDRTPTARALADDLRALGRDFPAEADVADVIEELMPAIEAAWGRAAADEEDRSTEPDVPTPTTLGPTEPPADETVAMDRQEAVLPVSPPGSMRALEDEQRSTRGRWFLVAALALVGVAVLAVGAVLLWRWIDSEPPMSPEEEPPTVDIAPTEAIPGPAAPGDPTDEPATAMEPPPSPGEAPDAAPMAASDGKPDRRTVPGNTRPRGRAYRPGSITIRCEPGCTIRVDGEAVAASSDLVGHAVEGGAHEVSLTSSAHGNQVKTFPVVIDGGDADLGCWDFTAAAVCD